MNGRFVRGLLGDRLYERIAPYFVSRSVARVIKEAHARSGSMTAETAIKLLFSPGARNIRPWQHEDELLGLARLIAERKPRTVVEIGTAAGGTLFLATCLAADDATIVSIDLPAGHFGGGYAEWRMPIYAGFARAGQRVELLRGDSHSAEMRSRLGGILAGRPIDFLFIDGDHSYEGVKHDFEMYGSMLSPNALVAFHDIVPDRAPKPDHFVSVFWNEIRDRFRHAEFVHDPAQSKCGLGVLFIGADR